MTKSNQIAVRLNDRTYEAVEEFAEDYDLTHSEALRRITEGRLAGEGYLSGPTFADGGQGVEEAEEIRDDVEQVSEELSEEVSAVSEQIGAIMLPLSLSILWIGFQTTVGFPFPPFGTVVTGIPLMLWLIYPQVRDML
jgi:hypothetical protein